MDLSLPWLAISLAQLEALGKSDPFRFIPRASCLALKVTSSKSKEYIEACISFSLIILTETESVVRGWLCLSVSVCLSGLLFSWIVLQEPQCGSCGCLSCSLLSSVFTLSPRPLSTFVIPCYNVMFLLLAPPLSVYNQSRNRKHTMFWCLASYCFPFAAALQTGIHATERDRPQG